MPTSPSLQSQQLCFRGAVWQTCLANMQAARHKQVIVQVRTLWLLTPSCKCGPPPLLRCSHNSCASEVLFGRPAWQTCKEQDTSRPLYRFVPSGVCLFNASLSFTAVTKAVLQRCCLADLPGKHALQRARHKKVIEQVRTPWFLKPSCSSPLLRCSHNSCASEVLYGKVCMSLRICIGLHTRVMCQVQVWSPSAGVRQTGVISVSSHTLSTNFLVLVLS